MATAKKATNAEKPLITKQMGIGEIAMKHPETFDVFAKYGMHCIGCVAARFENLEQGCMAHGIDADKMVKDLNAAAHKAKSAKK
jgi:hybrid cluster-associated redox disulfide protein